MQVSGLSKEEGVLHRQQKHRACTAAGVAGRRAWRYMHGLYCPLSWVIVHTLPLLVQEPSDSVQEALQNQRAQKAGFQGECYKVPFFSYSCLSEEPSGSKLKAQRTCQPCCCDKPCQQFGTNTVPNCGTHSHKVTSSISAFDPLIKDVDTHPKFAKKLREINLLGILLCNYRHSKSVGKPAHP